MSYFKPISISLSPNVEKDDVRLALNLIIRPWTWKKGGGIKEIEEQLKKHLGVKYAVSFNSGRSSLFAILTALKLEKQSSVLLQAFTCSAAINPILWLDLKPIYVDCETDSFNVDISDLKAKISPETRVLMLQHTFGMPSNMDEIMTLVQQHGLTLIEDCAHALGAEFNGQKVGTFGKAGFFSFSRDKVISSVYGGMAVTNDDILGKKLQDLQKEFGQPSSFWVFQQLLHPILLKYLILPVYNLLDLGKIFLVLSQWLHILSKAVHQKEKSGKMPSYFPKALPNALAVLSLNQFHKLDKFYNHRKKISKFYYENLKGTDLKISDNLLPENLLAKKTRHSFLRFTLKHSKAHEIIYEMWHKQNILIGDWYTSVIAPFDTKLDKMHYSLGMCPKAERLAKTTFNLPTHINISEKDAERIVNFLKKYVSTK